MRLRPRIGFERSDSPDSVIAVWTGLGRSPETSVPRRSVSLRRLAGAISCSRRSPVALLEGYHPDAVSHDSRIDAYLATLPADQRQALQRLRAQIARLAPEAVETISYGMPAFRLHGRGLVWYAGWKAHCSIYPLTDSFMEANAKALKGYRRTKGSLHFTPDSPLPEDLVERLVQERLADVESGGQ